MATHTAIQRTWTISDVDEVEETLRVFHRLDIPYTLAFDGGIASFGSFAHWSVTITLVGEIVTPKPITLNETAQ